MKINKDFSQILARSVILPIKNNKFSYETTERIDTSHTPAIGSSTKKSNLIGNGNNYILYT